MGAPPHCCTSRPSSLESTAFNLACLLEAYEGQPLQPPQLALLGCLPARDLVALLLVSRAHGNGLFGVQALAEVLLPRHPELRAGPWLRQSWLGEAVRREEALALESFGEDWQCRWCRVGTPDYGFVGPSPGPTCGGCKRIFRAMSVGPPRGVTVMPGSGFLWRLKEHLRPQSISWLASSVGTKAGGDGRIGCICMREKPGIELLRVYFNLGALWWEKSAADPIPILPEVEDRRWYRVRCCLDWSRSTADVSVSVLDGKGSPRKVHASPGLGFHGGCTALSEVLVGSVVFGSSPLSGCEAFLADVCLS
uniref:Uncharacterized protein n=1 Tax=Alexandrium monilatum TaxID=311494 RepID=A0A7S4SIG7_9DINO|mmetsp:Transcript_16369/g.51281  ORF Transcript_16369/g.51281 Transcript_16369/m.51281 type:complete len:308 (-) Transcript_16369:77-1000(-)